MPVYPMLQPQEGHLWNSKQLLPCSRSKQALLSWDKEIGGSNLEMEDCQGMWFKRETKHSGLIFSKHYPHYSKSSTYEPSCELSKRRTCVPSTSGVSKIAALCLLLLRILQLYHLHLLALLQSVTLLACSLDASPWMPAVVLYCCTFQGTVL